MNERKNSRIVLISQHFLPESGATAQIITDLAIGLSMRGWQVIVCTDAVGNEQVNGVNIERLDKGLFFNQKYSHRVSGKALTGILFCIRALAWCISEVRSSDRLLIVSNPPFIGLLGLCVKIAKKAGFVFVLQDIFPHSAIASGMLSRRGLSARAWGWLMRRVCISASSVVVLSESMQRRLRLDFGNDIETTVIHNWAIEPGLQKVSESDQPDLGYGYPDYFTIQYSGNFGRLHDIETILGAALLLRDKPIRFIFIGGGPKQALINMFIVENQLKNITVLPYQKRERLRESLIACDLSAVCLVSGAEELVAPCKLYGILASGKPVLFVAERDCDLVDLVATSECGIIVNPGEIEILANKILDLSKDRDLVERMGNNSRELYRQRFGIDRSIVQYDQVIRRCAC